MIYGLKFPQHNPGSMALLFSGPNYLTASSTVPYQQELNMFGAPMPCTIKLHVTAGDTLVLEQSLDGLEYETPITTTTVSQSFVLVSGCNKIRVTRSAGTSLTSYFTVC